MNDSECSVGNRVAAAILTVVLDAIVLGAGFYAMVIVGFQLWAVPDPSLAQERKAFWEYGAVIAGGLVLLALVGLVGWRRPEIVLIQLLVIGAVVITVAPVVIKEQRRLYPPRPPAPEPAHCVPISGGHQCPGG